MANKNQLENLYRFGITLINISGAIKITICNYLGEKIISESKTIDQSNFELNYDLKKFAAGIYTLQIKNEQGIVIRKIIRN